MSINSAAIYPFPQTPIPENEENEKNSVSQSVSSSTTTRARAREEIEEIIEDLSGYYCETFGTAACPPVARQRMRICLHAGMDPQLIATAMDEAAMAPRPSWAYAQAILMRLQQESCLTPEAYEQRQLQWAARRKRY